MWMNIVNPPDEHNALDAGAKACLSFHVEVTRHRHGVFNVAAGRAAFEKGEFKMIPFRLDYVIEKTGAEGACEEQEVLKELAGVRLNPAEARAEWPRVLEHKWLISERLSRDVGLRV